jgi:peroxiredoxin
MEALWEAGSAATLFPLADIRDWYIMHEPGEYPAEAPVRARLPQQLRQIAQQAELSPFPEAAAASRAVAEITTEAAPYRLIPVPGEPAAPNFSLKALSGPSRTLEALKGQVVLVNFWASWCPPCIEEMPSMNRIYRRYREQGLEILGINFQEEPEQIDRFLQRVAVEFPVLFDRDGAVAHQWSVFSMPTSFLLDRQGRVRYAISRSIHWDLAESRTVLEQLLAAE